MTKNKKRKRNPGNPGKKDGEGHWSAEEEGLEKGAPEVHTGGLKTAGTMAEGQSTTAGLQSNGDVSETMSDSSESDMESIEHDNTGGSSDEGASKRSRNESSPGNNSDAVNIPKEMKVIITLSDSTGHFHPIKVAKEIEGKVGKVKFAKILSGRRILIISEKKEQHAQLMKLTQLDGRNVKTHVPGFVAKRRGVITYVPLDMDMNEIKQALSGVKLIEAKRLQTTKGGTKTDSLSVLLTFEESLPSEVRIGWSNYKVREYIPEPLRCFKCQRMGHTASQCKGKQRCAKCGGDHEYGRCGNDAKLKCCNCGGEHSAAYAGCSVIKEAKEVQKFKTINKVSYAEAVKSVRGERKMPSRLVENKNQPTAGQVVQGYRPGNNPGTSSDQPNANILAKQSSQASSHICKVKEDTLMMDKKQFLTFICKVVKYVIMSHKEEGDTMRAVVTDAVKLFDMEDLKEEEIDAMIKSRDGTSTETI